MLEQDTIFDSRFLILYDKNWINFTNMQNEVYSS